MCNSFFAKNFRAFENIKITKLSKVNLFLGKNSVGKTALLEALYLYLHSNKVEAIHKLLVRKDEHLSDEDNLVSVESTVRHLFHNHQLPNFGKEGLELGEFTKQGKLVKNKLTEIKTAIDEDDEVLEVIKGKDKEPFLLRSDFDDFFRRRRGFRGRYQENKIKLGTNLQFVYSFGSGDVVSMWDKIALTDKQNKVIEALQIIEPNLTGIKFVEQDEYFRNGNRVAKASIEKRIVPFKSMGDGINRILYIVLSMVNAENGYLLVDEFENGLHYSVQKQVWKVIFTLAQSLNVQVFATTHSSDCIKAFGFEWQKNEDIATLHRIDFYNKKHSTMAYKFSDLDDALNTNTEVR